MANVSPHAGSCTEGHVFQRTKEVHCREVSYGQAVLAGVPASILCCVQVARGLWRKFSVVGSFAIGTLVFQAVP